MASILTLTHRYLRLLSGRREPRRRTLTAHLIFIRAMCYLQEVVGPALPYREPNHHISYLELHRPHRERYERCTEDVKNKSQRVWLLGTMETCYIPPSILKEQIFIAPLLADIDLIKSLQLAPTVIVTADLDALKQEAEVYARLLQEAGFMVKFKDYPDSRHGFAQTHPSLKVHQPEVQRDCWKIICISLNDAFESDDEGPEVERGHSWINSR